MTKILSPEELKTLLGFTPSKKIDRPEEVVHLTTNTTAIIIDIIGKYIYRDDPHADKATHPIEMNILDLLIEKLHSSIKERASNESKV